MAAFSGSSVESEKPELAPNTEATNPPVRSVMGTGAEAAGAARSRIACTALCTSGLAGAGRLRRRR